MYAAELVAAKAKARQAEKACRAAVQALASAADGYDIHGTNQVTDQAGAQDLAALIALAQQQHGHIEVVVLIPHHTPKGQ